MSAPPSRKAIPGGGADPDALSAGAFETPDSRGKPTGAPREAPPDEPGLGRTQVQSVVVTLVATGLLTLQNLVVLSLLDRHELGILGIASGVGSLALISQYFGVGAATLKEVSIAETRPRAFEIMLAGLFLRLLLAAPIVVALIGAAGWIASSLYGHPELKLPLLLFAVMIVLYGLSDVFSYTLQGLQLWRRFFLVKLLGAGVQLPIVVVGTLVAGVDGYFIGLTIATTVGTVIALAGVGAVLRPNFHTQAAKRLIADMRGMFSLGLYAYAAKIFQVLIIQSPILIAGYYYSTLVVGDLKFALTIGGVLLGLSGAVNTINMAVFSRRFAAKAQRFRSGVEHQVAVATLVLGFAVAICGLLIPDVVSLIGGGRYGTATDASVVAIIAAGLLGLVGLIVSTLHVPAGAYRMFAGLYLIPAVITASAVVAVSLLDGGVTLLAGSVLAGSAAGVTAALADMARRGLLTRESLLALAGFVGLAALPLVPFPDPMRHAVAALVLVAFLVTGRYGIGRYAVAAERTP
jgi:O-antigen/teichoic acid export membrane protein